MGAWTPAGRLFEQGATHIKICVSKIFDEIVYEHVVSNDISYVYLVDGYKQYAHRFFISDFLLFADNVNQPVLLRFFSSMCSSSSLFHLCEHRNLAGQGGTQNTKTQKAQTAATRHCRSLVHCRWISFAALHALYPCVLNEVNWVKIFW